MTESAMKQATILVVDDVRIIRRLVKVNLELEGYHVVEAENGEEALKKVRARKPDLILLDVIMPFLDGFQVLKKLRDGVKTRNIPVIMLTSCAEEVDQIKSWEMGISDYVTKPFNPTALINVIDRVLNESDTEKVKQKRAAEIAKLRMVRTIRQVDKDIL